MKNATISRFVVVAGEMRIKTRVSFPQSIIRSVDLPILYLISKYKGKDIHVAFWDGYFHFEVAMSDAMYEGFEHEMNKTAEKVKEEIEYNEAFIGLLLEVLKCIENARSVNFLGLKDKEIIDAVNALEEDINRA